MPYSKSGVCSEAIEQLPERVSEKAVICQHALLVRVLATKSSLQSHGVSSLRLGIGLLKAMDRAEKGLSDSLVPGDRSTTVSWELVPQGQPLAVLSRHPEVDLFDTRPEAFWFRAVSFCTA